MHFKACPHKFYFIGITAKRRSQEVQRLNTLYGETIPIRSSINKCLEHLCQNEPYRMLRDWTYDVNMDPLPSEENASQPEFTDVRFFKKKLFI